MHDVRLYEGLAVQVNLLVHQAQVVARQADGALDEGLRDVDGVAEYDNIAAAHVAVGQDIFRNRSRGRVSQFVDQQVIADEQRVFHGTRGNHERLHQRGGSKQKQDDGDGPLRNHSAGDVV